MRLLEKTRAGHKVQYLLKCSIANPLALIFRTKGFHNFITACSGLRVTSDLEERYPKVHKMFGIDSELSLALEMLIFSWH